MRASLRAILVFALVAPAPVALAASGGDPIVLGHSGYLLGTSDLPVDGPTTLTFRIFDDPAAGTLAWEGTCTSLAVTAGYYAAGLGSTACPGTAGAGDSTLSTTDVPPGEARWLEVQAGSVTLAPRLRMDPPPAAELAGHALDSDALEGHPASYFAQETHGHAAGAISGLATVATTGSYADLSDTPSLATVATTGSYGDLSGTPTLATVATTGSYGDLSGTPTLATVATTGSYLSLSNRPTLGTSSALDTGTAAGQVPLLGTGGTLNLAGNVTISGGNRFVASGISDFHNGGLRLSDSSSGFSWNVAPTTGARLVFSRFNLSTWVDHVSIDPTGSLLVGKNSPGPTNTGFEATANGGFFSTLDVSNDGPGAQFGNVNGSVVSGYRWISFRRGPTGVEVGSISTNGTSATSFNTTSDRRLKENVTTSARGLDVLERIQVHDFNFRSDPAKTRVQGFLAQELAELYPEAVHKGGADPAKQPWGVDYGRLTPLVVRAVQELAAENDALRARLDRLEQREAAPAVGAKTAAR